MNSTLFHNKVYRNRYLFFILPLLKLFFVIAVSELFVRITKDWMVLEVHWSNACLFCSPWKFEQIAIGFLSLMLRDDQPLPSSAVLFFIESLNHDSLLVRNVRLCVHFVKIILQNISVKAKQKLVSSCFVLFIAQGAISAVSGILKQLKRPHKKVAVNPYDISELKTSLQSCEYTNCTVRSEYTAGSQPKCLLLPSVLLQPGQR